MRVTCAWTGLKWERKSESEREKRERGGGRQRVAYHHPHSLKHIPLNPVARYDQDADNSNSIQ